MKKLLSGIIGTFVIMSALPASAAQFFLNDGSIEFNGKINDAVLDDVLTVNVVRSEFDWGDVTVWNTDDPAANSANIKYYDTIKTDTNGKYSIKFKLDDSEMGKYTVYLGSEYFKQPVTEEFYFTDKTKNDNAVGELNAAASKEDVTQLLRAKRYDLRLYSDKYTEVDLDKVGELVFDYLSAHENLTSEEAVNVIYQGFMVNFLNTRDIRDVSEYSDCFGMDGSAAQEYMKDSFGATVAAKLESSTISSIEDYEENMFYAMAGCIIKNNDGTGGIKAVLKEHMERVGSSKAVTDEMCSAIAGAGLYTKEELSGWISDYGSGNNGNNGSSSGGGGGYKTPQYESAAKNPFNSGYDALDKKVPEGLEGVFVDLDSVEWAKEAISALYAKGIISGRTERTFEPNDTVLREEFVKLLTSTFNLNLVSDEMAFSDVDENEWYYKYVNCAYASGIAKGFSDDMFGIGQNITRQDLCVMIENALNLCEINPDETYEEKVFTDENEIADYAKDAVARMQRLGVVNGYTDGSFNPNGTATRAESAKIMYLISAYVS